MFMFIINTLSILFLILLLSPSKHSRERADFKRNFIGPPRPELRHLINVQREREMQEGYFTWIYSIKYGIYEKRHGVVYEEDLTEWEQLVDTKEEILKAGLEIPWYFRPDSKIEITLK